MKSCRSFSVVVAVLTVLCAGVVFGSDGPARQITTSERRSDELAGNVDPGLIRANTDFAFSLFRQLIAEDSGQNVFISPFSIQMALAMTYNGASGNTRAAMAETLRFSGFTAEEINLGFRDLLQSIADADSTTIVTIANSIWFQEGYAVEAEFVESIRSYYDSEVSQLDLRIPADVMLYLINAIYFKGEWTHPFSPNTTRNEDFFLDTGAAKKVPMMHLEEELRYGRASTAGLLRLPYGREKLAMYILLPDEGAGVDEVIEALDGESWDTVRSRMEDRTAVLAMPRFQFEYGAKSLNNALESLGMGAAFDGGADFSGINPGMFIFGVDHTAVIVVNEEGSEAAAATAVAMGESAPPEMIEFIVNRPFLLLIVDDRTGSVLFMGKVVEP